MPELRGEHYVAMRYGKWDVVSESDDDELVIMGAPTQELAQQLCDVVNRWRQEHTG